MTLVKTSLLNLISVLIRVLTSLALNKIIASYVGPAGYAAIGQLQNFISMTTTFASGATNNGVTKYTAEYFECHKNQISIWRTAFSFAAFTSLITGAAIILGSEILSNKILKDQKFSSVFILLGISLIFFSLNTLLLAVLNGKKELNSYVLITIAGNIVGLIFTGGLVIFKGLYGALTALAINQSIVFFVTFYLCNKKLWFKLRYFIGLPDKKSFFLLIKFSFMAGTSAICIPLSQLAIRNNLGNDFGWVNAGQWEAMQKISTLYLLLITTPLTVYYLPRLSELKETAQIWQEIMNGLKIIAPTVLLIISTIYFSRFLIIKVLFTPEFMPMESLFLWQLVGDFLKIISLLFAHLMLAKALTVPFIVTEIGFSLGVTYFSSLFSSNFGFQGVSMAYAFNYLIYLIIVFFTVNHFVLKKIK